MYNNKHKWEAAENHMASTDTDWCKFKYCPNCGCLKEIWHNGVTYRIGNQFYDKMPKCIL